MKTADPESQQPIRVLHVVNSLEPGGMENGVCNIACGLQPEGVETHVACLTQRGAFAERLPRPGNVRVMGKRSGFSPISVLRLALAIRAVRPNVIHTHNLGPLIYASLATFGGRSRPIIQGEHSMMAPWELEERRVTQRKRLYRRCKAVHTVSDSQLEELQSRGFSHPRMLSIPNGVDTERFSPGDRAAAKKALGIPEGSLTVGLVGRFGPFKRHDALLDAFESLSSEIPRAHLVFVGGGGPEERKIRNRVLASAAHARIHLLGFQSNPAAAYRALDLLAIPSINEGMSNAALEAMSAGVAVLGNLGCGHEQIITPETDGIITDLSTPAAIGSAISSLLNAPERLVDMGAAARMTVCQRFSLPGMLKSYQQLYRACAR